MAYPEVGDIEAMQAAKQRMSDEPVNLIEALERLKDAASMLDDGVQRFYNRAEPVMVPETPMDPGKTEVMPTGSQVTLKILETVAWINRSTNALNAGVNRLV